MPSFLLSPPRPIYMFHAARVLESSMASTQCVRDAAGRRRRHVPEGGADDRRARGSVQKREKTRRRRPQPTQDAQQGAHGPVSPSWDLPHLAPQVSWLESPGCSAPILPSA